MYPTFSDLLHDLFGINIPLPIQTFGLVMALSFMLAAYTLTLEIQRRERKGLLHLVTYTYVKGKPASIIELLSAGIVGFLVGFKLIEAVFHYSELVNNPQEFILSSRGNFLGGIAIAIYTVWNKYKEKEKNKLPEPVTVTATAWPHEMVMNIVIAAALGGLIGAKVFHNLENIDDFLHDPVDALLSFSGLTFYGGLICGAAAVIWYAKRTLKIPALMMCDIAAPGLMLSYGTGRLGCHLSGDGDWGIVNTAPKPSWFPFPDWMWSFNYPHNVINEGEFIPGCIGKHCYELVPPVFPTPFYEAVVCILLFFVLWSIRKRITTAGVLFFIYLGLNGLERFSIEQIRINTKYHIVGHAITQAEIIAVISILLSITGIFWLRNKKPHM
jgi:prolipoprotein diacylglyceryltransferase